MAEREELSTADDTSAASAAQTEAPVAVDPLEDRVRIRIARFVGFSVGVTALFLWTLRTGDPVTGALAAVPIGYLAYRVELALFRTIDVRFLDYLD